MPPPVKVGAMIRRGAAKTSAETMKFLVENEDKAQAICDEIDARAAVFQEQEKSAGARVDAAEKAETVVAKAAAAVTQDRANLDKAIDAAAAKRLADMDALSRRTREVVAQETAAQGHAAALDARERDIKDHGIAQENEIRGRLEAVEAQEARAEEREQVLQEEAAEMSARLRKLVTVESLVKSAVAGLR